MCYLRKKERKRNRINLLVSRPQQHVQLKMQKFQMDYILLERSSAVNAFTHEYVNMYTYIHACRCINSAGVKERKKIIGSSYTFFTTVNKNKIAIVCFSKLLLNPPGQPRMIQHTYISLGGRSCGSTK